MKTKVLGMLFLITSLIFIFFPKDVLASCVSIVTGSSCSNEYPVSCSDGRSCCTSSSDCSSTVTTKHCDASNNKCGGENQSCYSDGSCDKSYLTCGTDTTTGITPRENVCIAASTLENITRDTNTSFSDVTCDDGTGIKTAIGCIHTLKTSESFLSDMLKWATGIGGGIAFLLILYAGFMIMTASGNPERLKAGQELLTSALSGLILLILSIFILKFIGIDILGLDKFGFGK